MSTIKVRGIQQTPNKQDIPGPIVEIQHIPAGSVIGETLVWDGNNWLSQATAPVLLRFTKDVTIGEIAAGATKDITVTDSRFQFVGLPPEYVVPVRALFPGTSSDVIMVANCTIDNLDTGELTLSLYNQNADPVDIEVFTAYFEVLSPVLIEV